MKKQERVWVSGTASTVEPLKVGDRVVTVVGNTLTVCEVIDGLMVRTCKDYNNLIHITKLSKHEIHGQQGQDCKTYSSYPA